MYKRQVAARALTGAGTEMKKGGVAGIRTRGRRGELLALLRPRELSLIEQAARSAR